jgi:acetate kinase
MGLTPLEGLVMGTRSGDLDPGALLYLARARNLNLDEVDKLLNKKSGLLGLSNISHDMREISRCASSGDQQALLAIQVFCYRIKKYIGAYVAALDGLDALIFTGGIGLGSAGARARVCQGLSRLGIVLDEIKNRSVGKPDQVEDISEPTAPVRVLVIPTDEEKMIARETMRALKQKEISAIITLPANLQTTIPIVVSARHVHLNVADRDVLFGLGYEFTQISESLGQQICKETVTLVGPRGKLEDVHVQGPLKPETQVEISRTEEFLLGVDAPIRTSGDLDGTPGITIEGPRGTVTLTKGIICAQRHIHMVPENALAFGLLDRDRVSVTVEGARPVIFGDVCVRVESRYSLEMHLDTDEANAAEVEKGMTGRITGIVERRAG